jgi:hypothetical protein
MSEFKIDLEGNKRWYKNEKLHREDGAAIEYSNGDRYWYIDGKLHRIDGPAIEWSNGVKWWYLNYERYNSEQFDDIVNFPDIEIP